jgi:hypothetical protein
VVEPEKQSNSLIMQKTEINIIHFTKVFKADAFVDRVLDHLKSIIKVQKAMHAKIKASFKSASQPPPVVKVEKIFSDESTNESEFAEPGDLVKRGTSLMSMALVNKALNTFLKVVRTPSE